MKKRTIVTAAAVAAAGIATYFVRRKMASRQRENLEPASAPGNGHTNKSSSKTRSVAKGKPGRPKSSKGRHS